MQTIPAIAMTKNIPVVPETPNFRRMTDEMMIVSIVMPETGLRAIVAIAFAATDAKKNEKPSARASAIRTGPLQRIAIAYVEWGAPGGAETVVSWMVVDGEAGARRFADAVLAAPRSMQSFNAIGDAIDLGINMVRDCACEPTRAVMEGSSVALKETIPFDFGKDPLRPDADPIVVELARSALP